LVSVSFKGDFTFTNLLYFLLRALQGDGNNQKQAQNVKILVQTKTANPGTNLSPGTSEYGPAWPHVSDDGFGG
jgi:hypothetical protein